MPRRPHQVLDEGPIIVSTEGEEFLKDAARGLILRGRPRVVLEQKEGGSGDRRAPQHIEPCTSKHVHVLERNLLLVEDDMGRVPSTQSGNDQRPASDLAFQEAQVWLSPGREARVWRSRRLVPIPLGAAGVGGPRTWSPPDLDLASLA